MTRKLEKQHAEDDLLGLARRLEAVAPRGPAPDAANRIFAKIEASAEAAPALAGRFPLSPRLGRLSGLLPPLLVQRRADVLAALLEDANASRPASAVKLAQLQKWRRL